MHTSHNTKIHPSKEMLLKNTQKGVPIPENFAVTQEVIKPKIKNFLYEMQKYANIAGKKVAFTPLENFASYSDMSEQQLTWYFYWRSEVRKCNYLDTDISYIYVYLFELLNGFGWENALEGYCSIIGLWIAYRQRFPNLDKYLCYSTFDFALLHNLEHRIPQNVDISKIFDPHWCNIQIESHLQDKPLKLPFHLLIRLLSNSVYTRRYFNESNLIAQAFPRVISLVDETLLTKYGKGILVITAPKREEEFCYQAFALGNKNRLKSFCSKKIKIIYKPYTKTVRLNSYIDNLFLYTYNELGKIHNFMHSSHKIVIYEEIAALISNFLKKEYSPDFFEPATDLDELLVSLNRLASTKVNNEESKQFISTHNNPLSQNTRIGFPRSLKSTIVSEKSFETIPDGKLQFVKDMNRYIYKTSDKVPFVPFDVDYATYKEMNKQQKSWYFYWRSEVRKCNYLDTDVSYIYVYVNELLCGGGWTEPSVGYKLLLDLWRAYQKQFFQLDEDLLMWSYDFALLYNLEHRIPFSTDLGWINFRLESVRDKVNLRIPLTDIMRVSDYSIFESKFYNDGYQALLEKTIPKVISLIDMALFKKYGKGILILYGPEYENYNSRHHIFQNAVCSDAFTQKIVISARDYISSQKLRNFITVLVKYTENILREICDYPFRLQNIYLNEKTAELIRNYLMKEYFNSRNLFVYDKQKYLCRCIEKSGIMYREVNLDYDKINQLRAESDAVRSSLEIAEETTEIMNQNQIDIIKRPSKMCSSTIIYFDSTNLAENLQNMISVLSEIQQKVLSVIILSDAVQEKLKLIADESMTMPDIVIDEINEIATQYLDDIVIESYDGVPYVLDQYQRELKNAVIK